MSAEQKQTGSYAGVLPPVMTLEGTPEEIGLEHGRLLGEKIRHLAGQIRRHTFRRVGGPKGVGLQVVARTLSLAMARRIPPRLELEMRALARGSGVPYSDILLLNTVDDVLNLLRRFAPRSPFLGCSSFAIFGRRTFDGLLAHGRNLDYHFGGTPLDDGGAVARLLRREAVLFAFHPHGRTAFVSIGWPGFVGTVTALNREGICLANLTSYLKGGTPLGVPSALLYRAILEEASSLDQVSRLLSAARRTIGNNLMVGSGRENTATLFEITCDRVQRVTPAEGMLVSTNHFQSPDLAARQRPVLIPHSVARWRRLRALCDRRGVTVREALAFLGDAGDANGHARANPLSRVANEGTAVSALFRPAAMEMWVGTNAEPPASAGEFQMVDASALLAK